MKLRSGVTGKTGHCSTFLLRELNLNLDLDLDLDLALDLDLEEPAVMNHIQLSLTEMFLFNCPSVTTVFYLSLEVGVVMTVFVLVVMATPPKSSSRVKQKTNRKLQEDKVLAAEKAFWRCVQGPSVSVFVTLCG